MTEALYQEAARAIAAGDHNHPAIAAYVSATGQDLQPPPAVTEYRYANSILWGPTYNEIDGMHHIFAASDEDAFHRANRCDKYQVGVGFLQKRDETGRWRPLTPATCSAPLAAALAS